MLFCSEDIQPFSSKLPVYYSAHQSYLTKAIAFIYYCKKINAKRVPTNNQQSLVHSPRVGYNSIISLLLKICRKINSWILLIGFHGMLTLHVSTDVPYVIPDKTV